MTSKKQSGSKYFVLYRRDFNTQKTDKKAKGREIYDRFKNFDQFERAIDFLFKNLKEQPILVKKLPFSEEQEIEPKYPQKPFVVSGFFENKYQHYSYDGSESPVPTHEIIRCVESGLEKALETFGREGADRIDCGIEIGTKGLLLKNLGL